MKSCAFQMNHSFDEHLTAYAQANAMSQAIIYCKALPSFFLPSFLPFTRTRTHATAQNVSAMLGFDEASLAEHIEYTKQVMPGALDSAGESESDSDYGETKPKKKRRKKAARSMKNKSAKEENKENVPSVSWDPDAVFAVDKILGELTSPRPTTSHATHLLLASVFPQASGLWSTNISSELNGRAGRSQLGKRRNISRMIAFCWMPGLWRRCGSDLNNRTNYTAF
jgi:hypothetical protein